MAKGTMCVWVGERDDRRNDYASLTPHTSPEPSRVMDGIRPKRPSPAHRGLARTTDMVHPLKVARRAASEAADGVQRGPVAQRGGSRETAAGGGSWEGGSLTAGVLRQMATWAAPRACRPGVLISL
mmetsp:Transcript_22245/g.63461  ORF Transcript_22245/g.63461 Transcript_22245/m.63461 type:complete len:126 (+) Transcript_22245:146-523(+)